MGTKRVEGVRISGLSPEVLVVWDDGAGGLKPLTPTSLFKAFNDLLLS